MKITDYRSDTVTLPVPEMLKAMSKASVGDDVYGEDPTVNELEKKVASMFNKEAALFVLSGTMANQIILGIATQPGCEILCAPDSHIYKFEGGAGAVLSGLSFRIVPSINGLIIPDEIPNYINPDDVHFPVTRAIYIENTHNFGGGMAYSAELITVLKNMAQQHQLLLCMDGARIFNAIISKGYTTQFLGIHCDMISICLSKGLGCPVGALIVGSEKDIRQAKRIRKRLGGGWRQAGYLAAAGLYALENHISVLEKDHSKAKELYKQLKKINKIRIQIPETNLIYGFFETRQERDEFISYMKSKHILISPIQQTGFRMVTHLGISNEENEKTMEEIIKFASIHFE